MSELKSCYIMKIFFRIDPRRERDHTFMSSSVSETEEWVCAKLTHVNGSVSRWEYNFFFHFPSIFLSLNSTCKARQCIKGTRVNCVNFSPMTGRTIKVIILLLKTLLSLFSFKFHIVHISFFTAFDF